MMSLWNWQVAIIRSLPLNTLRSLLSYTLISAHCHYMSCSIRISKSIFILVKAIINLLTKLLIHSIDLFYIHNLLSLNILSFSISKILLILSNLIALIRFLMTKLRLLNGWFFIFLVIIINYLVNSIIHFINIIYLLYN